MQEILAKIDKKEKDYHESNKQQHKNEYCKHDKHRVEGTQEFDLGEMQISVTCGWIQ